MEFYCQVHLSLAQLQQLAILAVLTVTQGRCWKISYGQEVAQPGEVSKGQQDTILAEILLPPRDMNEWATVNQDCSSKLNQVIHSQKLATKV